MCLEFQLGDHTEAARSCPAERPKQIAIRRLACSDKLAVCVHQLNRQEVVAGEPELPHEKPHATSSRMAGNPYTWTCSDRNGHSMQR